MKTIEDYKKGPDPAGIKKTVETAYYSLLGIFDEKDIDFDVPDTKKQYGIRFVIHDNLYRDGTFLRGEIQYNWTRDNLIDFNICCGIDRQQFIVYNGDPMKVFYFSFYADWTDPAHKYGRIFEVAKGVSAKRGRVPGGQVLYKTKGMYRAKGAR